MFISNILIFHYLRWFAGNWSKDEAERFLSAKKLSRGTFVIYHEKQQPWAYTLTVKDILGFKHYKIEATDDNNGFYITNKNIFRSLNQLIHYYKNVDELYCRLQAPVPEDLLSWKKGNQNRYRRVGMERKTWWRELWRCVQR